MSKERTIINGDFVIEACRERYNKVTAQTGDGGYGWAPFDTQGMEDFFFNLIEDCGVYADKTPSDIVDNALINGEWGKASDWGWDKEEVKEKYDNGEILYYEEDEEDEDNPWVIVSL